MKIIIIIAFIISLLGCVKDECDFPGNYEFVVYGEVTPYDSVYHVGDTLTLQCTFSNSIYEEKTNSNYNLTNLNIESSFRIQDIDTITGGLYHDVLKYVLIVPNNKFQYYIETYSSGSSSLYSSVINNANLYSNEIKIVLKKKGLFMFYYGPFSINNENYFEGKCKNKNFNLFTILNDNRDNNINYLKLSPDDHFNNWVILYPEERFKGGFAYKVID